MEHSGALANHINWTWLLSAVVPTPELRRLEVFQGLIDDEGAYSNCCNRQHCQQTTQESLAAEERLHVPKEAINDLPTRGGKSRAAGPGVPAHCCSGNIEGHLDAEQTSPNFSSAMLGTVATCADLPLRQALEANIQACTYLKHQDVSVDVSLDNNAKFTAAHPTRPKFSLR